MTDLRLFEDKVSVNSYQVDFNSHLLLPVVLQLFQECAYRSAEELGFGHSQLYHKNLGWVISKILIQIEKIPMWNENILIQTWPKDTNKLHAIRDFIIKDRNQSPIIKATSSWLLVDMQRKRPQRLNQHIDFSVILNDKHAIDQQLGKIEVPPQLNKIRSFDICYSDLDLNQHVNNTRYLQWILDTESPDFFTNNQITELEVNFLSEVFYGDRVTVYTNNDVENKRIYSAIINDKEREVCKTRINYQTKK